MPLTYESFGLKFLYPDNWTALTREGFEDRQSVTLEFPGGGFFSVERVQDARTDEELIDEIAAAIAEDYRDTECESINPDDAGEDETVVEFRFYYLDFLIISRFLLMPFGDARIAIQAQAESRDFDRNEQVFAAILKQIRAHRPDQ